MTRQALLDAKTYFEQLHHNIRRKGGKPNRNELVALELIEIALGGKKP